MTPCPHCQGTGVPLSAKRRSSREHPAVCSLCGKLSHVIASSSSGIFWFSLFIVGTFYLIGAINEVTLLGWLGVPIAMAYYRWAWKRAALWPITGDSAKSSRQASRLVNALGLLGIFWS
jgi:hypothetical protein